jgi:hypothetical protein
MSSSAYALYAIVARDARVAVVFRRGPTRHVRMLRWDLAKDDVEPGQWLYGTVETTASALSPDGELVAYCARKRGETFTAVSRPRSSRSSSSGERRASSRRSAGGKARARKSFADRRGPGAPRPAELR